MNRNRHRVVFNAARGQRMVVGENASSCAGGSACGELPAPGGPWTPPSPLVSSLALALAFGTAHAQIVADPGAPGSQRPIVLQTANGTPLIQIRTPSAAGVSRNTYSQFDIQGNGAVLNNVRSNAAPTQIGGLVQANPFLATGSARVILNEVNSSNPSYLNGPLEVAGQRAEVIVANPSGIRVNGGTFLNASGVTLTTGTPVMNSGHLDSFLVRGGTVHIEGLGLDTRTADTTTILARAVEVNAGMWAGHLKVVSGANEVSADASTVTATPGSAQGPAPQFALDVAAIGGMYAGKIFLVGTEAGLGINNAGRMSASSGDFVLQADGWLRNTGSVQAQGQLTLQATDVDNRASGQISATTTVIQADNALSNRGLIDGQVTRIEAVAVNNLGTGRVYGGTLAIQADTLRNDTETVNGVRTDAVIAARQRLDIGARDIANRDGALIFSGGDLAIEGALDVSGQASGHAQTLHNASATIESLGDMRVAAAELRNTNEHIAWDLSADPPTPHTEYYTSVGILDASEVAWIAGKLHLVNFGQGDQYFMGREEIVLPSSVYADPVYKTYYHGPTPFVEGHYAKKLGPADDSEVWVGDEFNYGRDSAVWAQFGVTAPTWDAPGQMPRGTDEYGNPVDPQAVAAWKAQAAPWIELNSRIQAMKDTISSQMLPYDAYRQFIQTTQNAQVTQSQPGRLISAGRMTLDAPARLLNQDSHILAGGALNLTGQSVTNEATQVPAPTQRTGTLQSWGVTGQDCDLFGCDPTYGWIASVYQETIAHDVPLNAALVQAGSAPTGTGTALPTSALFQPSASPTASYLIETDPRFTDMRQWLSSDYLLQAMAVDPATVQKRLGDGFYEQRLVREQIGQLTGRRFVGDHTSDEAQYQALMTAGATFAQAHQLRPGISLTMSQVAQLTSDIVWLETQTITLPDGSTQTVLVPRVYLMPRDGDLAPSGALLAGKTIQLDLGGDLVNTGTIAGRQLTQISAENVHNLGGHLGEGGTTAVTARQDIDNLGGSIAAQDELRLNAGRDLTVQTTTSQGVGRTAQGRYASQGIDRVAGLYVSGDAGVLLASAGRDTALIGAVVQSAGSVQVTSGGDIHLGTVKTTTSMDATRDARNHTRVEHASDTGTQVQAAGGIELQAGRDVNARAATVQAGGRLGVQAARDVNVTAGEESLSLDTASYAKGRGALSSGSTEIRSHNRQTDALASNLGGEEVNVQAGQDVTVQGSNVIGDQGLSVQAGGDVAIVAAQTQNTSTHFREDKGSGFSFEGGITYGSHRQSTDQDQQGTGSAASTVGAIAGNVNISAGKTYKQVGSDVLAPGSAAAGQAGGGDITIAAQQVQITEARETSRSEVKQAYEQSGITLAMSSPVMSAMQTVGNQIEAAGNTKDARMKGMAAANGAFAVNGARSAIQAGQGTTINGKANQVTSTNLDGSKTVRDATAADQAGGINLTISIGASKSESQSRQTSDNARGSTVAAGGNVSITASGQGADSNILIRGSDISAGDSARLSAEGDVNLQSAQNTASLSGSNKSSSGSVGFSFGTSGFGITASASAARGREAGDDLTHTNTHITAGNAVRIQSGNDTTLQGALVKADTIEAEVGGDLKIESLQDVSTYTSKQSSASASVTIGAGAGGSFSASKSNVKSEFASVAEQSGLKAGDGGFQVNVNGNTELIGGAITSNQTAVEKGRNELTTGTLGTRDLQNRSHASASSSGFNLSSDMATQGKYGVSKSVVGNALNQASESSESSGHTLATVSGARVTITDGAAQKDLTGEKPEEAVARLHRDANAAHVVALRQDTHDMQKRVEAERVIREETIKAVTALTDEAYRSRMQREPKLFRVECPSGEDCVKSPELLVRTVVTKEEIAGAADGSIIAVNGILNDEERAAELAFQNAAPIVESEVEQQRKVSVVYLMHIAPADNTISELMGVAYEKLVANADYGLANFLGYTNGQILYADLLRSRGGSATQSLGHSRGTLVQEGGVDPSPWTHHSLCSRSRKCPKYDRRIRRNSASRWSSWFERGAHQQSSRVSSA